MMKTAIVYGDISPNVVDGSSIWLSSITEVLATIFDQVHLQLKMKAQNDRIIGHLRAIENIIIHEPDLPEGEAVGLDEARHLVEKIIEKQAASAVIVRGLEACNNFCQSGRIAPKLWSYVTDVPFPPHKLSNNGRNRLNRIATRSHRMFAQTEAARSYLESIAPMAAGKTVLLNPMIPASAFEEKVRNPIDLTSRPLRLVYSGKFAKSWKTLEMLQLPASLKAIGIEAELIVVGDKFNRAPEDPNWVATMRRALTEAHDDPNSRVSWLGGMTRDESLKVIRSADIGVGWRTSDLDSTLELSTKALEYAASGTVPLLNVNGDHQILFGEKYQLFVTGNSTANDAAQVIASALPNLHELREDVRKAADYYSMPSSAERLRKVFSRSENLNGSVIPEKRQNLLVVSHDLKFMGDILPLLKSDPGFVVRYDDWESLHHHDEEKSAELAQWADVIFCEFAGPSVSWYSKNKKPESSLVCRIHGFELRSRAPWLATIDYESVDDWIVVSSHYQDLALELLPISQDEVHIVPNTVDLVDFDRPKMADAQFQIGMVGIVPFLKRPDRALDLIEILLREDDRYALTIKGRMPWDYPHEWKKSVQRQLYMEFFSRIADNSKLKRSVVFSPFSANIANWHRGIGIILSPSDLESFHLAPAEGMAARTVPFIWERTGAAEVFGSEFVFPSTESVAQSIWDLRDDSRFLAAGEHCRKIAEKWDVPSVYSMWREILNQ